MHPITLRGHARPARAAALALAISLLSAAAAGPTVAVQRAPASGPPIGLEVAPGLVAEAAIDPGLAAGLTVPPSAETAVDEIRTAAPVVVPVVKVVARAAAKPTRPTRPTRPVASTDEHRGRNHVWSSSFGLDRATTWFSCTRSQQPGYSVYRWGCAGSNNVYLFAHAGGPFHRLHDLYVGGRLRKGMAVTYADANGHVHRYTVAWWRTVLPTDGEFAYAAQSRPSMTLQTCVGKNDRYRLIVRLYRDD
jgi:Sortase domain